MALSELPVNHLVRNATTTARSRPFEHLESPTASRISDKINAFSRDPSTIQSMLKNTTETGEVGPFSTRPSRFPQSMPRTILTQNVVGQQYVHQRSSSKQYHGDIQHNLSASHPGNYSPSGLASVHVTQSQRSYQTSSRDPISEDDRSYSIARSSHTNRSVPSPRLHSSHRFQAQGDMQGARPRSPYAYPTRLKRPGYRPSSPAYSDLNRPFPPPHAGFHPEASLRAQSPMSISAMKRLPPGYQHDSGQQGSTFPYRSSSPGGSFFPASTRAPTPGLPSGLGQYASKPREASILNSAYGGWDGRQSASPLPIFYDYTEAFEERSNFHMPTSPKAEQAMLQNNANVYHEPDRKVGSANSLEIFQKGTAAQSSCQEEINDVADSPKSLTGYRGLSLRIPPKSFVENEASLLTSTKEEHERTDPAVQDQADDNLELSSSGSVKSDGSINLQPGSPTKSHTGHNEATTPGALAFSVTPGPQSISSGESMYSVPSSRHPESSTLSPGLADTIKPPTSQVQPRRSLNFTPRDPDIPVEQLPTLRADLRELSFDRQSDSEQSQIYAPTPERLLSSPSHRRRFSRIFSIGEGSIGDGESNIASERAIDDQRIKAFKKETETDPGDTQLTHGPRPDQTSMSLPGMFSAVEELGGPALREAGARASVLKGNLGILESTQSNTHPTESLRGESGEATFDVSTPPLIALELAATEKQAISSENSEIINQTVRTSAQEPNRFSAESILLPAKIDIPSLQSVSTFRSYSPPPDAESTSVSHPSTTVLAIKENNTSRDVLDALSKEQKQGGITQKPSRPILNLKKRAEKASIESLPGSRPWNLATSYPWTDEDPKLEVTLPDTNRESQISDVKLPRFRLKIHRASSSTGGPVKLAKSVPPPLELSAARKTSLSSDLFSSSTFNRKPRPSVTITQNNSSHTGPITARFAGSLTSPRTTSVASPCISLVPPSPGLNLEVRSFFSDDSSQVQPKGSLRKRISQLRAMAARGSSSDEVKDAERGLLSSAMGRSRTSGRSIQQEAIPSEGIYNLKHIRWRLEEKVKDWLHRSRDKVRSWSGKMRLPGPITRPGARAYSGF